MVRKIGWAGAVFVVGFFLYASYVVGNTAGYKRGLLQGARDAKGDGAVFSPISPKTIELGPMRTVRLTSFSTYEEGRYKQFVCAEEKHWESAAIGFEESRNEYADQLERNKTVPVRDLDDNVFGIVRYVAGQR